MPRRGASSLGIKESLNMDRHTQIEVEGPATREKAAINPTADFEATFWHRQGVFDWTCTFSFDQRTNRSRALTRPNALHDFVEGELRRYGYRGPFVIVAHDNSDTRYYHAHVLLSDYKPGMCAGLVDHFRKFGNVSNKDDGPIRGMDAFNYCANRAYGREYAEPMVRESLGWLRTPRKRGSGRGRTHRSACVSQAITVGAHDGGTV